MYLHQDSRGFSLLHTVLQYSRDLDILRLLIDSGTDVTAMDNSGIFSIDFVTHEHIDLISVLKLLLKEVGADVNSKYFAGFTPLHKTSRHQSTDF